MKQRGRWGATSRELLQRRASPIHAGPEQMPALLIGDPCGLFADTPRELTFRKLHLRPGINPTNFPAL